MTNTKLIEYYVNLIIMQYKGKEKAETTLRANAGMITIYELIKAVEAGYNIDSNLGPTAVGDQLDVIAKYVGATRIITGVDFTRTFFGFVDYSEPTPYTGVAGAILYAELNPPDAQMLTYNSDQESVYTLTDSELLMVIKFKIAQNNSNHSVKEIDDILNEFLNGQVIFTDEENMTMLYIFDSGVERLVQILQASKALPKPAGVGLEISYVPDLDNIFGMLKYDSDSPADFVQGMIKYSDDPFGSFLTY